MITKDEVDLEPLKHSKSSAVTEGHCKKLKTMDKKEQKALESSKRKHSEERASIVNRKELKTEKRNHSEAFKNKKTSLCEKRIKTEVSDKKHHSKLKHSSKFRKESFKPNEDWSKEVTNAVTPFEEIKKEKPSKHTDLKNIKKIETKRIEKVDKDFPRTSTHGKHKNKSSFSGNDKTPKDHKVDKNQHNIVNCDNLSKPDKSKNCISPLKNNDLDKDLYSEVNHEVKLKDEQLNMLMEERKLKERLMQSYYKKQKNEEKLLEQERILKQKLVKKFKAREIEKIQEKEKLRKELSGRKILKSVLADTCTSSKKY